MKRNNHRHDNTSSGFTIVELMIATAVFSTILVAITVGVIHFSALYYKGVYTSETQNAARDISDEIANAVKFGAGDVVGIPVSDEQGGIPQKGDFITFCAGGYVFATTLGQQYDGTATTTGLYMQPKGNDGCTTDDNVSQRKQLLAKNMRVSAIQLYENVGQPNVYTFKITLAYAPSDDGDDDSTSVLTTTADPAFSGTVHCKSGAGSEYCAVSSLITTIQKRI